MNMAAKVSLITHIREPPIATKAYKLNFPKPANNKSTHLKCCIGLILKAASRLCIIIICILILFLWNTNTNFGKIKRSFGIQNTDGLMYGIGANSKYTTFTYLLVKTSTKLKHLQITVH